MTHDPRCQSTLYTLKWERRLEIWGCRLSQTNDVKLLYVYGVSDRFSLIYGDSFEENFPRSRVGVDCCTVVY